MLSRTSGTLDGKYCSWEPFPGDGLPSGGMDHSMRSHPNLVDIPPCSCGNRDAVSTIGWNDVPSEVDATGWTGQRHTVLGSAQPPCARGDLSCFFVCPRVYVWWFRFSVIVGPSLWSNWRLCHVLVVVWSPVEEEIW